MNSINKKLSLAIYWHMHQPVYDLDGVFYMPWTRLHAVKDYLDMINILEKYPKLKLNFDVVPALMDDVIHYTEHGFNDIHSSISLTPTEELMDTEKEYILNNFFNSKYETMVYKYPRYRDLYKKRLYENKTNVEDYTDQEYSDIIALFNLSWIDPTHKNKYPELNELINKSENYTLKDREKIMDIHLQIMKEIIPTYRKYIQAGRIDATPSPYYHPILPILCDYETTTQSLLESENLPLNLNLKEDAHQQIKLALDKAEEVFGVRPKGIWAPEYCLTDNVLKLLIKEGIKWTISDEAILSRSINFEFVRDFKGNLEDPYYLLKTYKYSAEEKDIKIIFRDSLIPNLINFEYCNTDAETASNDFYNKIKSIQNKLIVSPDENHLLTISLDGENCWENYDNDGNDFLDMIYTKITSDESIETVLISDYISADRNPKMLNTIYPGSWINKNFNFWIGDPVKNLAWQYLNNVRNDIVNAETTSSEKHQEAMKEIYIAEGSDWFWWYGEPNNSGQDNVFDFLFREHLKNAYKILGMKSPKYLDKSIIETATKADHYGIIHTSSNSFITKSINLTDGPVFHESKLFDSISYGANEENAYFELKLNANFSELELNNSKVHQFHIYMRNSNDTETGSHIRIANKTDIVFPVLKNKYHSELAITLIDNKLYSTYLSETMSDGLWKLIDSEKLRIAYDEQMSMSISIPFNDIGINHGETLECLFITANVGLRTSFMPKDSLIHIPRP